MKRLINITDCREDIDRYRDANDMEQFLNNYGCHGFEYMPVSDPENCHIPPKLVCGLHMRSFNCWMDLWMGNQKALIEEYGSWEQVEKTYGGRKQEDLVKYFRRDLELARRLEVQYVVFHISEVKIRESFTYKFDYTDEEVVDAAAELINLLMDEQGYSFYFLMENLWWPGLRFTRPEITRRLLDKVHDEKKGLILDTGHLLHTNLDLKNQEEGLRYINRMLDEHKDLLKWIKGMHLQQSITSEFVKGMLATPMEWAQDYYKRWCQVFSYIFQIDLHQPFAEPGVRKLVERVAPQFLTYELISRDREEHERLLREQTEIFT